MKRVQCVPKFRRSEKGFVNNFMNHYSVIYTFSYLNVFQFNKYLTLAAFLLKYFQMIIIEQYCFKSLDML